MNARTYIKQRLGIEINNDNESDDCDLSWTDVEFLMEAFKNQPPSKFDDEDDNNDG